MGTWNSAKLGEGRCGFPSLELLGEGVVRRIGELCPFRRGISIPAPALSCPSIQPHIQQHVQGQIATP